MQKLYTGPDAMFARAKCANCNYIAVNAKDCQGCHKVICGYCVQTDGAKRCGQCQTPFDSLAELHPMVSEMFERATFKCIY